MGFGFSFVLFWLFLIQKSRQVGTIWPGATVPIENSIANKDQFSTYTFTLYLETTLYDGALIEVEFPDQYDSGLGISSPSCTYECSVSDNTVTFNVDETLEAGVIFDIYVEGVQNPSSKGGTGNFMIWSKQGQNIVDENKIFYAIGVADDILEFPSATVELESEGLENAGSITKYKFSFTINDYIPEGSYFKFVLPDMNFQVAEFPICTVNPVNGVTALGNFICESDLETNEITVTGFDQELFDGDQVSISLTLINPPYSYTTDSFAIYAFRDMTTVVYEQKTDIDGVEITPGVLENVEMEVINSDFTVTRDKEMWFSVSFENVNPIPEGGLIEMRFPVSFAVNSQKMFSFPYSYYIYSGLEDLDEENYVDIEMDTDTDIMTITSFKRKEVDGLPIVLHFMGVSPDNSGDTSSINITTYLTPDEDAYTIDEDTTFALINIESVTAPASLSCTASNSFADESLTDIDCSITPEISVPGNGYIRFIFDRDFTVDPYLVTTDCYAYDKSVTADVDPDTCEKTGTWEVWMQITSEQFTMGLSSTFGITNQVTTPKYGGDYFIEITTYQRDGSTIIESGNVKLTFTARPFAAFSTKLIFDHVSSSTDYYSALLISATASLELPTSKSQRRYIDQTSFIHLQFVYGSASSFTSDLGFGYTISGAIPCLALSGLTPYEGDSVNCTVYVEDPPRIAITNFQAIGIGESWSILFPNVLNPDGSFEVEVSAVIKEKRELTLVNFDTVGTLGVNFAAPSNFYSDSGSSSSFWSKMTSTYVDDGFDVSFDLELPINIASGSYLLLKLPTYDLGFIRQENSVWCEINNIDVGCAAVETADIIFIEVGASTTYLAASDNTFTIHNLQWPRYRKPKFKEKPELVVVSSTTYSQLFSKKYPRFPVASSTYFPSARMTCSKPYASATDVTYTFQFKTYNAIPAGSSLQVVFPFSFSLKEIDQAIQVVSSSLESQSDDLPLSWYNSKYKLTIYQFAYIPAQTSVSFSVSGVTNPSARRVQTDFSLQARYNDYLLTTSRDGAFEVDMTHSWAEETIVFGELYAYPLNAATPAIYSLSFTIYSTLSQGASIHIRFPAQFKLLPITPTCFVSGALTSFEECYSFDQDIVIVTDSEYPAGGLLEVEFWDIENPDEGDTDALVVFTEFDGEVIDITDDTDSVSLAARKLSVLETPYDISLVDFDFEPVNEREEAEYVITFLPTNDIETDMEILFIFPEAFDQRLGNYPSCEVESGLAGDGITCSFEERRVSVTGFDFYDASQGRDISIRLRRIINPNRVEDGDSGYIGIATATIGSQYFTDYLEEAGLVETLEAPGWAFLYDVTATNQNSRLKADYQINTTLSNYIPKESEGGYIQIKFPTQFSLDESEDPLCQDLLETFATSLSCQVVDNVVWITGNTDDFNGNLQIYVEDLLNPEEEVATDNLFVASYDDYNKKIIEKSFENLDPFYFAFTFSGPQIIINNNKSLSLRRGVYSDPVSIEFEEASRSNLTLVPSGPHFSFIPYVIEIPIGQTSAEFQVSVPYNFEENDYTIEWSLANEEVPAYYVPIKDTTVSVLEAVTQKIEFEEYVDVPINGTSLALSFSIGYAPDIGIDIELNLLADYPGLELSTDFLSFSSGETSKKFSIDFTNLSDYYTENYTSGEIVLTLGGVNQDIFELTYDQIYFSIIDMDQVRPKITSLDVSEVEKTNVTISFTVSEPAIVYYMVALNNSEEPPFSELQSGGPAPEDTTLSMYGSLTVDEYSLEVELFIDELTAETDYTMYLYAEDKGHNHNSNPASVNFTTDDRYSVAEVTLRFNQYQISDEEKEEAIIAVANTLSIPEEKVKTLDYSISSTSTPQLFSSLVNSTENADAVEASRRLAQLNNSLTRSLSSSYSDSTFTPSAVESLLTLLILPFPSSPTYLSPKSLGASLNDKISDLVARLPNLDSEYSVQSSEFPAYIPGFVSTPTLVSVGQKIVTVKASLSNYGQLWAVAIEVEDGASTANKPSPFQIYQGTDYQNKPAPSGSVTVSETYTNFQFQVSGLVPETDYVLFVIGGSITPTYPDLMSESFIEDISFTTNDYDPEEVLDIDASGVMRVGTLLVFLLHLFVFFFDL